MLMRMSLLNVDELYFFYFSLQADQIATKGKAKNGEKFCSFHTYHSACI